MFSKRVALIYYHEVFRCKEFVQDPFYTLSKPGIDFLVVVSMIFLVKSFVDIAFFALAFKNLSGNVTILVVQILYHS